MRNKPLLTMLSTAVIRPLRHCRFRRRRHRRAAPRPRRSDKFTNNVYIVRLAERPVVAYDGGIKGFGDQAAQGPEDRPVQPGGRQLPELPRVAAGRGARQRRRRQEALQLRLRVQRVRGRTDRRAGAEAGADQGRARGRRRTRRAALDTSSTPAFLGLTAPGGFWAQLAADQGRRRHHRHRRRRHLAREPELLGPHRHQRQRNQGRQARLPADPGLERHVRARARHSTPRNCNQKLIGARYYNAGWGGNAGIDAQLPWEFNSPRDFGGHGTHTATHRGWQRQRAGHGPGVACSARSAASRRARASRPTRCAGRPAPAAVLQLRQRRGHRPGRGRRRRRDQLLDQRLARRTSATRSRSRSCMPPTRACSSRPRRATAARRPARWRTRARGSRRSPPARTTATATARSPSAMASRTTALRSRRRSVRRRSSTRRPPACPARIRPQVALCYSTADGGTRARPGQGRRQDRASAIAASPRASTRAWRCRKPAASAWCW